MDSITREGTMGKLLRNSVVDLLIRHWGIGVILSEKEKDVLLAALDEENKFLRGPIHVRGLERLKEMGIE